MTVYAVRCSGRQIHRLNCIGSRDGKDWRRAGRFQGVQRVKAWKAKAVSPVTRASLMVYVNLKVACELERAGVKQDLWPPSICVEK